MQQCKQSVFIGLFHCSFLCGYTITTFLKHPYTASCLCLQYLHIMPAQWLENPSIWVIHVNKKFNTEVRWVASFFDTGPLIRLPRQLSLWQYWSAVVAGSIVNVHWRYSMVSGKWLHTMRTHEMSTMNQMENLPDQSNSVNCVKWYCFIKKGLCRKYIAYCRCLHKTCTTVFADLAPRAL